MIALPSVARAVCRVADRGVAAAGRKLGHSAATLLRDYARVWEDFDPSQRVDAEEQIERVRSRLNRAEAAQAAERGVRRRARSASRKGRRVPQVFRDVSDGSGAEKDKTAD